jgi:predicted nucleic acid-binding protein
MHAQTSRLRSTGAADAVTFLDAYALIAFLVGGPAAPRVREILRAGDAALASANLAETLDVSQRLHGLSIARAMDVVEPLLEGPLRLVVLDLVLAHRAAEIRAHHYHRSSCPISLADAILIASAGSNDCIATADPHMLAVAKAEDIDVVELPEQG